ncbi:MAG: hypothetical protein RI988_340 [Pseudomonadota bacterium]
MQQRPGCTREPSKGPQGGRWLLQQSVEAERIQRRHFNSTARRFGYGETAEPLLQELIARTPVAAHPGGH